METPILPLPAVLRGDSELEVYLRLPSDFVSQWTKGSGEKIPALPHYLTGGTRIYYTAQVLDWLRKYFGFGGDMNPIAARPVVSRPREHLKRREK